MTATIEIPVEREITIDRATLLARALDAARNGEPELGVWFATMVGDPRYDVCPVRLPVSMAKRLGLV